MSDRAKALDARAKVFSQRLRTEHSIAPQARDVIDAEETLGTGAIGFQLSSQGRRLLLRAQKSF